MLEVILLPIGSAIAGAIASTGVAQRAVKESCDRYVKEAYKDGYSDGYNVGYAKGKSEGYSEGYDVGFMNGASQIREVRHT